jgi:hypothetical protein
MLERVGRRRSVWTGRSGPRGPMKDGRPRILRGKTMGSRHGLRRAACTGRTLRCGLSRPAAHLRGRACRDRAARHKLASGSALHHSPDNQLSLLLFPVDHPELFDAVVTDEQGRVSTIQVRRQDPTSGWIWGVIKMPGHAPHALHALWCRPERRDEYFGRLINQWLAESGEAFGIRAGREYLTSIWM